MNKELIIFSDGGARGNPGPAGVGAVIFDNEKNIVAQISEFLGHATNNQAEYKALIMAMEKALELGAESLKCYLDSELVVKQLNKEYKVKDQKMQSLFVKVYNLSIKFKKVEFFHVPRSENTIADKLANEAMDRKK